MPDTRRSPAGTAPDPVAVLRSAPLGVVRVGRYPHMADCTAGDPVSFDGVRHLGVLASSCPRCGGQANAVCRAVNMLERGLVDPGEPYQMSTDGLVRAATDLAWAELVLHDVADLVLCGRMHDALVFAEERRRRVARSCASGPHVGWLLLRPYDMQWSSDLLRHVAGSPLRFFDFGDGGRLLAVSVDADRLGLGASLGIPAVDELDDALLEAVVVLARGLSPTVSVVAAARLVV